MGKHSKGVKMIANNGIKKLHWGVLLQNLISCNVLKNDRVTCTIYSSIICTSLHHRIHITLIINIQTFFAKLASQTNRSTKNRGQSDQNFTVVFYNSTQGVRSDIDFID